MITPRSTAARRAPAKPRPAAPRARAAHHRHKWTPMSRPDHARARELFADLSSNNPSFDAHQYAAAGHILIGNKATQGVGYINPTWLARTEAAHLEHMAVLHYHFADGGSPTAEAAHFVDTIRSQWRRGDRAACDLEQPALSNLGAGAPAWLAEFDAAAHRLGGLDVILYTFSSALNLGLRVRSGMVWDASFGPDWPAGPFRRLPNGQQLWGWQFTDGEIGAPGPRGAAGIGRCDMSVLAPPVVRRILRDLHSQ
ncbi:MAG TPA: glycoside hydrolase family 25 protein [Solirubrobacteraceae bacterium]|nr:glycoside hydrolase family 25 protein [Solirubrobacteraceae bacterium]